MDHRQKIENSIQARLNDYLGSFKSLNTTVTGADAVSEPGIDDYLLERAAAELRAAQLRAAKHKRQPAKD